jgi:hypothetical protein
MQGIMSKSSRAIAALPEVPNKHIYWIVYNQDMVKGVETLIANIKGPDYMKYITVVAKSDPTRDRSNGLVYFDPSLLDLLGNGNV